MARPSLLPLFLLVTCAAASATPPLIDRYTIRGTPFRALVEPMGCIDPTFPPVLKDSTPTCSVPLVHHDFGVSSAGGRRGYPSSAEGRHGDHSSASSSLATAEYIPPDPDQCPWTRAVLELSASASGEQHDRVAAVWIDGVEVLRASTAEPTESGVFWTVRSDVTRYSSLLRRGDGSSGLVSVTLQDVVAPTAGDPSSSYSVNVSLHFYDAGSGDETSADSRKLGVLPQRTRKLGASIPADGKSGLSSERLHLLYGKPADLIVPIANENAGENEGFWFRIATEIDSPSRTVPIPRNAHRALMEVRASPHASDEFWYSSPPNSYIDQSHRPATGRANGPFRQIFAAVDGLFVGGVVPFPVIYPGGINPLFWSPVVSLGAFDLPSYDLELTPFLGNLVDGNPHEFSLGVTGAVPFWLVGANLHLWLDQELTTTVEARLVEYTAPLVSLATSSKSQQVDGKFKTEAEREVRFSGWVSSSLGNLTHRVEQAMDFEGSVEYKKGATAEEVKFESKTETVVKVEEAGEAVLAKMHHKAKFPLKIETSMTSLGDDTCISETKLSHGLEDKVTIEYAGVKYTDTIDDEQEAKGWMVVGGDRAVIAGSATTEQKYESEGKEGCYERKVKVRDGVVQEDEMSRACNLAFAM